MSNWKQVIADAKELLDLGAITPEEFEQAKREAIELRTQITNVTKEPQSLENVTLPPSNLSGMGTMVGSPDMLGGLDTMGTYVHQSTITKVGSYILMGEIGKGGMGTVYRARHSIDAFADKVGDVVVKLMHPEFAQNPDFVQRFIGEAALGRTLSHPNFVKIHDIVSDSDNKTLAIVMDLVEGRPLEDVIPDSGMPIEEALPIIEKLCSALDYMHEQGVLHRDLKPENIIIQPNGTPVILDMGIAKDTSESDLSQTSTGMAMGTPLYMAPEQLDAKNATSAVDRFAFGLIVYQMLSGGLPWEDGLGQGEILAKKFSGNLRPLEHDSKEVSNAVMGLLRAGAADRTESCAAFFKELTEPPKSRRTTGVVLGKSKSSVNPGQESNKDEDAIEARDDAQQNLKASKDEKSTESSISLAKDSEVLKSSETETDNIAVSSIDETASTTVTTSNSASNSVSSTNSLITSADSNASSTTEKVESSDKEDSASAGSGNMKMIGLASVALVAAYFVLAGGSENDDDPAVVEIPSISSTQATQSRSTASTGGQSSSEITLVGAKYYLFDVGSSHSFRVGSNHESREEKPAHDMRVSSFYMGEHEVTVGEYKKCMDAGACSFPEIHDVSSSNDHYCTFYKDNNLPLNCVTWSQASRFCDWAGGRLPTEAEWEYAATSGGKDRRFPWGDSTSDRCSKANVAYGDASNSGAKYPDRRGCGTNAVARPCSKTAGNTDQGLCDMSGNLWEFTQNCDYNYDKSCSGKVHRGGGFWSNIAQSRSTRRGFSEGNAQMDVGFRCVKDL